MLQSFTLGTVQVVFWTSRVRMCAHSTSCVPGDMVELKQYIWMVDSYRESFKE